MSSHPRMIRAEREDEDSRVGTALSPRVEAILLAQPLSELRRFVPQRYKPNAERANNAAE